MSTQKKVKKAAKSVQKKQANKALKPSKKWLRRMTIIGAKISVTLFFCSVNKLI